VTDEIETVVVERAPDGALEARARDVTLRIGRHADGALRSVELLLAALGSCMLGTMLVFAENVGVTVDGVRLELRPILAAGPERVQRIEMHLHIDGDVDPRRRASLRRVAEHCKVHATLEHGPELTLTVDA
jgi:uncharacterized OsmC-like protein